MREVVVIGGGPAGLAAAAAAREAGAAVVLLEAGDDVGGQYWRHLPPERPARAQARLHHGWSRFTALRAQLAADPGCTVLTGASVWAVEPVRAGADGVSGVHPAGAGLVVRVLVGTVDGPQREHRAFAPDALVIATGAHDLTLPFPGWDLPGVVTGGGAQSLAKGERIGVGERVVVAGAGPFLLPVAASLLGVGSRVVEVAEAAGARQLVRGWAGRPWRSLAAGGAPGVRALTGKTGELAGYAWALAASRVPYRTGTGVVAARGDGRVEEVVLARLDQAWAPVPGTERVVAADAVAVTHGFTPRLEVALAAGCARDAAGFVAVDARGHTSAPGVWAAGEVTGIGGAELALAEGALAGSDAAAPGLSDRGGWNRPPRSDRPRSADRPRRADASASRRRAGAEAFAARLAAAHAVRPGWVAQVDDDTVVCRCEEVTAGRLREVAAATASAADDPAGPAGARSLRLTTRAGLGPCQGRICGYAVDALLGRSAAPSSQHRPLAVPVRLGELAAAPTLTHTTSNDTSHTTSNDTEEQP